MARDCIKKLAKDGIGYPMEQVREVVILPKWFNWGDIIVQVHCGAM